MFELKTRLEDLELLIDKTPEGVWLLVAPKGTDPGDENDIIAAVKLDYFEGKLQVLAWDRDDIGLDPCVRHVFGAKNL